MRFSIKTLLAVVTACCVAFAAMHVAGFWVAIGVLMSALLLRWAIVSPRKGYYVVLRFTSGLLSLVVIWFLAVEWSWFVWECPDCLSNKEICEYRVLGLTISGKTHDYTSTHGIVLSDLGVPCPHANAASWHKHRLWGLVFCICPCWNGTLGLSSDNSWYSNSVRRSILERGRSDPSFADEVYRQTVTRNNFRFLWDAVFADEIVKDGLKKRDAVEASLWLDSATDSELRILDCDGSMHERAVSLIDELYSLGATRVLVVGVTRYDLKKVSDGLYEKDGYLRSRFEVPTLRGQDIKTLSVQDADMLAVELPSAGNDRDNLFSWEAEYHKTKYGDDPSTDYGQSFLLIHTP